VKPASSAERLQAMLEEIKRDMSRLKNGVNQLSESTPVSLDPNSSKITKKIPLSYKLSRLKAHFLQPRTLKR
jgi:hypothetical protein